MASEQKRGCGYRKVGALYLCGSGIWVSCDRLPYELESCPVCGAGIHFTRAMTEVNPFRLMGNHDGQGVILEGDVGGTLICGDKYRPCHVCDPPDDVAYIMTVGKKYYTPELFIKEAHELGVSKKIATIPKKLEFGKTIVYLAHPEAVNGLKAPDTQGEFSDNGQARLLDAEKLEKRLGIFCSFIPERIEMPCWESQLKGKKGEKFKESLEKRGITPIPIPNGDPDHS